MMKKMVKEGISLVRGGKRVTPEVGVAFEFTKEEIEQITKVRPQAIGEVNVTKPKGGVEVSRKPTEKAEPKETPVINKAAPTAIKTAPAQAAEDKPKADPKETAKTGK